MKKRIVDIKWITTKEVFNARKDLESALKMSLKHWTQIRDAGCSQFLNAYRSMIPKFPCNETIIFERQASIQSDQCALCQHRDYIDEQTPSEEVFEDDCEICPLYRTYENSSRSCLTCCDEWNDCFDKLSATFDAYPAGHPENIPSQWDDSTYLAIDAMVQYIEHHLQIHMEKKHA